MRAIGLDIHRDFCEVAIAEGGRVRAAGRVGTAPAEIEAFARGLGPGDTVTLEATGNALAIARILERHVRVVLANPKATKAATRLRAKTDGSTPGRSPSCSPRASCPRSGPVTRRPTPSAGGPAGGSTSSGSGRRPRTRSTRSCCATSPGDPR